MELGLNNFWPTEILYDEFKNLKLLEELQNYLLSNFLASSIDVTSEEYSLFEIDNKILNEFKKECLIYFKNYLNLTEIDESVNNFKLKAWTRGFKDKNSSLLYHNHNNSLVSAIFYVLVDTFDSGGELVFHDPRINANRGYSKNSFQKKFENINFKPKTGDLLIFPSFLYHHVERNSGTTRILVSVDLF
jgi:hypothetical protein